MALRAERTDCSDDLIEGLAPIARRDARVLILGSMPGVQSLLEQRYYAHPANAFWPLMSEVLRCELPSTHAARREMLIVNRIALWDVVHRCRREGSLDAAIDPQSVSVNDIAEFLRRHRSVQALFFNGGAAASLFQRHLRQRIDCARPELVYHRLPSSSPANASWSRSRKIEAWTIIREYLL
jgi:double-stranded uracil-DNA glycosylase